MIGIYVHIPFCESKCVYCAFASFICDKSAQDKYFDALKKEIENCTYLDREVSSIYFGGGTPSCVSEDKISVIMEAINRHFKVLENAEITIECNPCSATFEKLSAYKKMGFNRISFGVQSLDNKVLKFLGRRHNKREALEALENARRAGFENISADLLLGLPGGDVIKDAGVLIKKGVKHLSAYMLQVEGGTPLFNMVNNKEINLPSDDQTADNYNRLALFLDKNGLKRYEISNFALEGFESKHNSAYWTGQAYLGFGLGAHSFDGKDKRWANAANFDDYYAGKVQTEKLSELERDEEIIMLGLRCKYGFNINSLSCDLLKNKNFSDLISQNIITKKGDIVTLNPSFYEVSNSVILKLLEE